MKLICIDEVESLNIGDVYKVKNVKKVEDGILYEILYQDGNKFKTAWIDSKKFKYPMKWIK